MAYLMKRSIRGKKKWVVCWIDYRKGKGSQGIRQVVCDSVGASNDVLRKKLLKQYKEKEGEIKKSIEVFGYQEDLSEKSLTETIKEYLAKREEDVEIRRIQGGRNGISLNTLKSIQDSMRYFQEFVKIKRISKCKELTPAKLQDFRRWIQTLPGINVQHRSTHYLNLMQRNLKSFLNSYKLETPPIFLNLQNLVAVLKALPTESELPFHFSVNELQSILRSAINLDTEQCIITREKHDKGKKFNGSLPLKNLPIFPMLVLVMLTGMRKGEALNLTWDKVDLDSGVLRVKAQKTGKERIIPLADNVHGVISPTLIKLLRLWKLKAKDKYVLPHPQSEKPTSLKHPLERFKKMIDLPTLTYQNLRKNFVSYTVSFGVTPAICAFWSGHSPAVAERNYLQYAFDRLKGDTIEEAMGISDILHDVITGYEGKGKYKNIKLTNWVKVV